MSLASSHNSHHSPLGSLGLLQSYKSFCNKKSVLLFLHYALFWFVCQAFAGGLPVSFIRKKSRHEEPSTYRIDKKGVFRVGMHHLDPVIGYSRHAEEKVVVVVVNVVWKGYWRERKVIGKSKIKWKRESKMGGEQKWLLYRRMMVWFLVKHHVTHFTNPEKDNSKRRWVGLFSTHYYYYYL